MDLFLFAPIIIILLNILLSSKYFLYLVLLYLKNIAKYRIWVIDCVAEGD